MAHNLGTVVWICVAASLCQVIPLSESAHIVFFFGVSSYSHRVPAWPLAEALSNIGHNVTFISPYPAKNPNPKIFDYVPKKLKDWVESWDELENVFEDRRKGDWMNGWLLLPEFGKMMCEEIYKDEEYLNWVQSTKVDLVFLDSLSNDCAYGMVHYWGAKLILFATTAPFAHFTESYGIPDETSWIPSMELSYPYEMTFSQRLKNALLPVAWHYYRKWTYFPKLEAITSEKLKIKDLPNFEEIERNTSLVFLNTHYGEEFARALPSNVIAIGGIAYKEKRTPLPKEMETFLAKGDAVIYISFGTYADFLKMDKSIQQAFIGTMQKLSHIQFIWKVANDSLTKEFPQNNVYIDKWMPQQDILAHPRIRAFITHSGLLGIQEAIYNSVPLISFPIFADQDYNAERIHRRECGIRLEITSVTQSQLEGAIVKVLTESKYRENMKKISALFKERPQKPLDTALWWTDFVLRHSKEDLAALRPLNIGRSWWERRQLDVWATIALSAVAVLSSLIYLVYILLKCTCISKTSSPTILKKKTLRKKEQ